MRNVVDWGGELASDQRLSGLARERSERARPSEATKCPWGASAQYNANFQSISYQLTVFLRPVLGSVTVGTGVLAFFTFGRPIGLLSSEPLRARYSVPLATA
uniref:Uncharacterized protein n=1 Tax=OCS116 cluster bacterium TaxID=2030921 RepID=A0A2A4Z971_9PROT